MITVVGLGVEYGDLTKRGEEAILKAAAEGKAVVVRTAKARSFESVKALGVECEALDYIYEKSRSFSTLNKNLAKKVLALGEGAVYCVDGSAAEDNSVKLLKKRLKNKLTVISGVSKISYFAEKAGFTDCSYTAVSAYELLERAKEGLNAPLIVYDIDDSALAADVKLILADLFGDETNVKFLGERVKALPLYELDRQKSYDYLTAVALERVDTIEKKRFTVEDLHEIVVRLRKPNGCPWDRVQTCETIKMNVVEEAYELVDAIDSNDDEKLLEETGDILLQAIFHAVIKAETGAFNFTDVVSGVCDKLISRHTHIFGKDKAENAEGALSVWDKNKMKEKHQETFADSVNDVPKCFPAALRAQKVGKRAAKAGLDFASVEEARGRILDELKEFDLAFKAGDKDEAEKEIGDVLFAVVSVARKAGLDAEKALKESVERFAARFCKAEELALSEGKIVTELSPEAWDKYYEAAKRALKD